MNAVIRNISLSFLTLFIVLVMHPSHTSAQQSGAVSSLKVATFNVSMESQNYQKGTTPPLSEAILKNELASGQNDQIRNIARIIQMVRPDVILLNEFDYIENPEEGIQLFIKNYLQKGESPIDYPYFYYNTVNTGQPSPFDLDNDGKASQYGADAWGYGLYPGQYGMVLLSKYPIQKEKVRTFQHFKWKDMPGALLTKKADGSNWYSKEAWEQFPLSSKAHWDIPIRVGKNTVHFLASHPTPPAFDGPEDRNGKRNHDEIRFWKDYINGSAAGGYIYDDQGQRGGLTGPKRFVILGDQNASPDEGNARTEGIQSLLQDPLVLSQPTPASDGGAQHSPNNPVALHHTASWRMRADYVLPSRFGFTITDSGIFWPTKDAPNYALIDNRGASSDHRLVWVALRFKE
ncbi:endonuclease/exonuclease/phosphatase family protein [Dyadobacter jejuensis]|nr:endonuclease/exonuclease/phosphatase family protein [Dyadobacter jejuensis]